MIGVTFLGLAVSGTALGQTMYKLSVMDREHRRPALFVAAAALFMLTQGAFFVALQYLQVGTVYMATGLTHVLVLVLARFVLHEILDQRHLTAVSLIVVGLLLYAS